MLDQNFNLGIMEIEELKIGIIFDFLTLNVDKISSDGKLVASYTFAL